LLSCCWFLARNIPSKFILVEHLPDRSEESGQFFGKLRSPLGFFGKLHQFLADEVVDVFPKLTPQVEPKGRFAGESFCSRSAQRIAPYRQIRLGHKRQVDEAFCDRPVSWCRPFDDVRESNVRYHDGCPFRYSPEFGRNGWNCLNRHN